MLFELLALRLSFLQKSLPFGDTGCILHQLRSLILNLRVDLIWSRRQPCERRYFYTVLQLTFFYFLLFGPRPLTAHSAIHLSLVELLWIGE